MAKREYKYEYAATEFASPIVIGNFPKVHAGSAEPQEDKPDSLIYAIECYADTIPIPQQGASYTADQMVEFSMYNAAATVAYAEDPTRWTNHLFAPDGVFHKLEEMRKRKHENYPYAAGKYVLNFKAKHYPEDFESLKNYDSRNPEHRDKFQNIVAGKAPGCFKYCNVAREADIKKVEAKSNELRLLGRPAIPEAEYHVTVIPVDRDELQGGHLVRVLGHFYWSIKYSMLCTELDSVLLIDDTTPTLGGSKRKPDPDRAFRAFAPAASLAPPPRPMAPPPLPVPSAPPSPPVTAARSAWNV